MAYVYIFLGGGMGSICRFLLAAKYPFNPPAIPWGTFLANLLSCIILGMVIQWMTKSNAQEVAKWLLVVGFCGGFSTFSTFTFEVLELIKTNAYLPAVSYVLGSIVVGLLGLIVGTKLMA